MTDPAQSKRKRMVDQIQRTRLGGPDRITLDMFEGEEYGRYAHIYEKGLGPNLHTTEDPRRPDPVYDDGTWKRVGVIDLDTGEAVDA